MSGDSFPPVVGVRRGFPPSSAPLEAVRVAWEWLCARPHPVSVDGTQVAGLPDRPVPLDELRARLLGRGCSAATRDAVWAHLVRRARAEGGTWTVAAAGMALPVLVRVARILTARFANDPSDIHAAVVAGFLHGLTRVDPDRSAVLVSLRWAAYRGGLAAVRDALRAPVPVGHRSYESSPPHRPAGHPDLVLARAVADKAITADEAALIGSTRLEHVRLVDAAAARGQTYTATNTARYRAERRLLAYLTAADTTPEPATTRTRACAGHPSATAEPGTGQASATRRRRARNDARRQTRNVTASAGAPDARASASPSRDVRRGGERAATVGDAGDSSPRPRPGRPGDRTTGREPVAARRRRRSPHSPEQPARQLLRSSDPLSDPAGGSGVPYRRAAQPTGSTAAHDAVPPRAPSPQKPVGRDAADSGPGRLGPTGPTPTGHTRAGASPRPGTRGRRRATRPGGPPTSNPTTPTGIRSDAEPS